MYIMKSEGQSNDQLIEQYLVDGGTSIKVKYNHPLNLYLVLRVKVETAIIRVYYKLNK